MKRKRQTQQTRETGGEGRPRRFLLLLVGLCLGGGLAFLGVVLLCGPSRYLSLSRDQGAGDLPAEFFEDPDVERAEEMIAEGRVKPAVEHLWAAHRRRPEASEPLVELARIYLGVQDLEKATEVARQAWQREGAGTAAHLVLGECLEKTGRANEAEQVYIAAAKRAPERPQAFYRLGRIAAERGQDEVALGWYRKSLEADPAFAPAAHHLAIQFRMAGKYGEAVALLQDALEADPGNASLRCNLAHTYLKAGDPGSAAREFREALPTALEKAETCYFLGRALEMLDKHDEARDAFHAALRWDRHLYMAWYSLAQLEKREGLEESSARAFQEFEKARALRARLAHLRESVMREPRDVARLLEYAQALLERDKPQEALGPLRRAGELDPGNVLVPKLLEQAYEQISELAKRHRRLQAEAGEVTVDS